MSNIYSLYKRIMKHDPKVVDDIKSSEILKEQFNCLLNCNFMMCVMNNNELADCLKGEGLEVEVK